VESYSIEAVTDKLLYAAHFFGETFFRHELFIFLHNILLREALQNLYLVSKRL
jgi:hypothetical protein